MRGKRVEKLLERIGEDNLVVLPRVDRTELSSDIRRRGYLHVSARCCPWMQFEVVVQKNWLLPCLRYEEYSYLNLKLAPSVENYCLRTKK